MQKTLQKMNKNMFLLSLSLAVFQLIFTSKNKIIQ